MLDQGKLGFLLNKGRVLQEEIGAFVEAPTPFSARQLAAHIDALNSNIKRQLLGPSCAERNELGLVIVNLARIAKNLDDIKHTITVAS